jgi:hypothetical protein
MLGLVSSFVTLTRPWVRLSRGLWADARAAADRIDRSWLRVFPSARAGAAYARALALHLEGRLDEALAALGPLRDARPVRSAVLVLEGATLVLADRDPARAAAALAEACKAQALPEDLLLFAHARLAEGNREDAERLFAAAGTTRPVQAGWRSINEPTFHFLRGLYLRKVGRDAEATKDLELAAASPIGSVYVERARAILARPDDSEPDPRSSLAPQVMDEE